MMIIITEVLKFDIKSVRIEIHTNKTTKPKVYLFVYIYIEYFIILNFY
jgi:hypothetical protein